MNEKRRWGDGCVGGVGGVRGPTDGRGGQLVTEHSEGLFSFSLNYFLKFNSLLFFIFI